MSNYEYTVLYCGILYRRIFQDLQNFRNIVLLLSRSLCARTRHSYFGYYFITSLKFGGDRQTHSDRRPMGFMYLFCLFVTLLEVGIRSSHSRGIVSAIVGHFWCSFQYLLDKEMYCWTVCRDLNWIAMLCHNFYWNLQKFWKFFWSLAKIFVCTTSSI